MIIVVIQSVLSLGQLRNAQTIQGCGLFEEVW